MIDITSFFLGCIVTLVIAIIIVYFDSNFRPRN